MDSSQVASGRAPAPRLVWSSLADPLSFVRLATDDVLLQFFVTWSLPLWIADHAITICYTIHLSCPEHMNLPDASANPAGSLADPLSFVRLATDDVLCNSLLPGHSLSGLPTKP